MPESTQASSSKEIPVAFDETVESWPNLQYIQELTGNRFHLVESQAPRFVFFGPHPRRRLYPRMRSYSPTTKPPEGRYLKLFWTNENVAPDFDSYDWLFTFYHDDAVQHPRHLRKPVWHPALPLDCSGFNRPASPKTRFCNFIYSRSHPVRERFFDLLSQYKRVDAPGMSKQNMPPIGDFGDPYSSRYQSRWEEQKLAMLRPYKFTIAFENACTPGYVTEKIYHPMLADSVPIYWGNQLVSRDYNQRCFLNAHDFESLEKLVERVIELDNNEQEYAALLKQPFYDNQGESVTRHLDKVRERLITIFSEGATV